MAATYPLSSIVFDNQTYAADGTVSLPALVKASGTVANPNGALAAATSHVVCNGADPDGFPAHYLPFIGESSTGNFLPGALDHKAWIRKGVSCTPHAYTLVEVGGAVGAPPAILEVPFPTAASALAMNADTVRDFYIPALGTVVTLTGTVKDTQGNPLPGYDVSFVSAQLTGLGLDSDGFHTAAPTIDGSGAYTVRVLPGTYRQVEVKKH